MSYEELKELGLVYSDSTNFPKAVGDVMVKFLDEDYGAKHINKAVKDYTGDDFELLASHIIKDITGKDGSRMAKALVICIRNNIS